MGWLIAQCIVSFLCPMFSFGDHCVGSSVKRFHRFQITSLIIYCAFCVICVVVLFRPLCALGNPKKSSQS